MFCILQYCAHAETFRVKIGRTENSRALAVYFRPVSGRTNLVQFSVDCGESWHTYGSPFVATQDQQKDTNFHVRVYNTRQSAIFRAQVKY